MSYRLGGVQLLQVNYGESPRMVLRVRRNYGVGRDTTCGIDHVIVNVNVFLCSYITGDRA